jgi:hypothetical protein
MLKKPLLLACLFFSQYSIANEALPPILDYQPLCSPILLDNISHNKTYPIENGGIDHNQQLNQSLLQVRQQAKTAGADAVIINNISQFMTKKNKNQETVNITITADAITYCKEDQSLSTVNTPFNSAGKQIKTIEIAFTLPVSDQQTLERQAKKIDSVDPSITLTSAFGVTLGATAEQLLSKLGPPSAAFTLDDDTQAWVYGRNITLTLVNQKFVAASFGDVPLNASGKNQIEYTPNYDDITWNVLSKINYQNELTVAKKEFGKSLIINNDKNYVLKGSASELELKFEHFISTTNITPIAKLVGFTLTSNKQYQHDKSVRFAPIKTTQLQALFSKKTTPLSSIDYIALDNQNTFNFTQTGKWHLLTKNILVQKNDEEIDHVKLLSGLTEEEEDASSFAHVLNTLALPNTKADFMRQYPNAEDNFDSVLVSDEKVFIEAIFDSESHSAKLVELDIKYF